MKALFTPLALAAALTGCALSPTTQTTLTPRQEVQEFTFEGRFALRARLPGHPEQSGNGRLTWQHTPRGEQILLANPLGYGIAEITMTSDGAVLRTADGETREAADPAELIEQVTGQRLPLDRFAAWLIGRPGPRDSVREDAQGRPVRLSDANADWQIDYAYAEPSPDALPQRITLRQANRLELRLRAENWTTSP